MAERLRLALSLGNRNNASEPAMVVVAGDFNIGPEHQMMAPIYALGLRHVFNPHRAANLTTLAVPPPPPPPLPGPSSLFRVSACSSFLS